MLANKRLRPLFLGTLIGVAIAIGAFIYFMFISDYSHGFLIRPYYPKMEYTDHMKGIREDVEVLSKSFDDLITIISSAFGFIAFLVSYQVQHKISLSTRAWSFLSIGVIVLIGGFILCLFGKELLIKMSILNSVNLDLPALSFSRVANYYALIFATVCVGFYALEIASNSIALNDKINHYEDD